MYTYILYIIALSCLSLYTEINYFITAKNRVYHSNHIACIIITFSSNAINPESHNYNTLCIATFSNRTLKFLSF